jgi:sorbitol-specific phosphotransferase system component IIBC
MVSPNLVKNSEKVKAMEINENAKKLFQVIYTEKNKKEENDENIPKIKVSSLVSRLAFFYEKARNAVDYEEEHLLRKIAIARILKRQVVIEGVVKHAESEEMANHLLTELIRGGYLPNNTIPETRISEVASIIEKYIRLKDIVSGEMNSPISLNVDINAVKDLIKEKNKLISWFMALAACEIEEGLAPNNIKKTVVGNMFEVISKKIKLPNDLNAYQNDLEIQT